VLCLLMELLGNGGVERTLYRNVFDEEALTMLARSPYGIRAGNVQDALVIQPTRKKSRCREQDRKGTLLPRTL